MSILEIFQAVARVTGGPSTVQRSCRADGVRYLDGPPFSVQ